MKKNRVKRVIKWFCGLIGIGFIVLQFFNPSLKNPPVEPGHDLLATNPPPAEVAELLHEACYDCHSQETRWPWYAHVAPVSWWLLDHLREGREKLNFSEWPHGDSYRMRKRLQHIGDVVEDRSMPLPSYTWMHPKARLTEEQRGRILKWAETEAKRLEDADNQ